MLALARLALLRRRNRGPRGPSLENSGGAICAESSTISTATVFFNRGDTTVIRIAIAILFLLPALALGQTKEKEDEDKVSNDNPARPLQMPPASTEVKESLDDFERFQRRGAWERALKALYTVPEDQVLRFIDGDNGFIVPVGRKRRGLLTALSPNGQAAYRLFYDALAQKLFDEAEGPNESQEPRTHLLGLLHHVDRRQRRRSVGRSLL